MLKNKITSDIDRQIKMLKALPQIAYDYWVSKTPKLSGNARRRTTLKGDTIHANYAYAQRLDEGYSKKAPQGMSEPTNKEIERQVNKITRKGTA